MSVLARDGGVSPVYTIRRTAWGQHQVWNTRTGIPMGPAETRVKAALRAADLNRRAERARASRAQGRA